MNAEATGSSDSYANEQGPHQRLVFASPTGMYEDSNHGKWPFIRRWPVTALGAKQTQPGDINVRQLIRIAEPKPNCPDSSTKPSLPAPIFAILKQDGLVLNEPMSAIGR
jgi:hypothetical protein